MSIGNPPRDAIASYEDRKWKESIVTDVNNLLKIVTPGVTGVASLALTVYANNAAAIAGGLKTGAFYRSGGNPSLVCVVY